MTAEPALRMLRYFHATTFHPPPSRLACRVLMKVVVEIKSAVEPRRELLAVQNHSSNESRGVVTLRLEQLRPRGMISRQRHGKVGHTVVGRQQSSQNRSVRSVGDRAGSKRLLEADAIPGQAVQCRSLHIGIAITMDVVGAQGVDGHRKTS